MKLFEHTQAIYYRNEISEIADYLMSHQTALRDEFLGTFSSLKEAVENQAAVTLDRADYKDSPPNFVKSKLPGSDEFVPNVESWRNVSFKYQHRSAGLFQHLEENKIKKLLHVN